jgi:predicted nuclease of predicted toxin-antitoxin system
VRFLVDAQLPPKLAHTLVELGHQAEHLEDVGLRHAKDGDIWNYAVSHQAVIVSKDEDFVDRFRRRGNGPVIVWLRIGNSSNRALLAWFVPLLPALMQRIQAGDKLIEVR